ncbi:alpha/beta fold hydrolase [Nocardia sp. NPDC056100]|uniref:alpha/beta fold hydrolase n=1 Tax=Nocardia sp. NPDC056100 TaxID=3345712 RepID=UPI0035D5DB0C
MDELRTCTVENGRRVAWAEYGDPNGVPIVFSHGTPGGRLGVAHHHDGYLRQGLRVISPDRPGYGATGPLPGRSVYDAARDTLAILDVCGLDRVFAVGGSGGGPHALALAVAAPERIRSVGVFVGAAPLLAEEIDGQVAINQAVMARLDEPAALRELLNQVRTSLLEQGLAAVLADAPDIDKLRWAEHAESRQRSIDDALAPGVQGMADDYRAIFGGAWGFEPSQVAVPVVWAHGDQDRNVPVSAARRIAEQLPDCRFVNWTEVGHSPGPDLLAEFYTAVLASAR